MNRYIRQVSLPGFGEQAQEKLRNAHVLCIGAGGLGSPALMYLAAAGVGTITIVDDDVVEESNLHRQIIHSQQAVGSAKVEVAKRRLEELNPEVQLCGISQRFAWPKALEYAADADLILDGSDNFDTRYVASTTAVRLGIAHVWGSILGYEAQLSVFAHHDGPVYEDVFPHPPQPGDIPNCAQAGVLGPVVGIIGSAMALEAIKIITGIGDVLSGTIGYYDGLAGSWEYIPIVANPLIRAQVRDQPPRAMVQIPEVDQISRSARCVIDVREPEEFAAGAIPTAINMPLSQLKTLKQRPSLIADGAFIYCATGVRSQAAWRILRDLGVRDHVSLKGGYDHWFATPPE